MKGESGPIDPNQLLSQTGWLRKLALSLVQDPERAEDLQQEALLAALEARSDVDIQEDSQVRAWLAKVTRNLSHLGRRKDDRRRSREETVARPEPTRSAAEVVERAARLRMIVDQVMDLEEPSRSCILLRFFEGLTTREIAAETGATEEAVRQRISRGLARMRVRLDGMHGGDRQEWFNAIAPLAGLVQLGSEASTAAPVLSRAWKIKHFGGATTTTLGVGLVASLAVTGAMWFGPSAAPESTTVAQNITTAHEELADARSVATAVDGHTQGRTAIGSTSSRQPVAVGERRERQRSEIETRTQRRPRVEVAQRQSYPVKGRVLDLSGYPLGGLDVVTLEESGTILAVTAEDGSFEVVLNRLDRTLSIVDDSYVTLAASRVVESNRDWAHAIVAARGSQLGGRVLDAHGRPLPGAEIDIEYGDGFYVAAPMPLDRARLVSRGAFAGEDGAFALAGLFRGPDVWVVARHPEHRVLRQELESFTSDVELRLEPFDLETESLTGVVRDADGYVVAGALVRLGSFNGVTDDEGRVQFPGGIDLDHSEIWAYKRGFKLAHLDDPEHMPETTDDGEFSIMLEPGWGIDGEVLDDNGYPAIGWTVAAVPTGDPAAQGHEDLDELASLFGLEGLDADDLSRGKFIHAGPDGEFQFDGLVHSNYMIVAWNPSTHLVASTDIITEGRELGVVVQPEPDALQSSVKGHVVGPTGIPVAGALVSVDFGFSVPDGFDGLSGLVAETDAQGVYSLDGVPRRFVKVNVSHESSLGLELPIEEVELGGLMALELPARRQFRVEDAADWSSFVVVDDSGDVVPVFGANGSRDDVDLFGGRSAVLSVSSKAVAIQFTGPSGAQRSVPLDLVDDVVVDLRP